MAVLVAIAHENVQREKTRQHIAAVDQAENRLHFQRVLLKKLMA